MNNSTKIQNLILELIQTALLRIRSAAWAGDAARCAVEADHIHNLPTLLKTGSPELLRYYWDVERPSFLTQSDGVDVTEFERLWDQLAMVMEEEACSIASPRRSSR